MPYSGLTESYNLFKDNRAGVGIQLAHKFTVEFSEGLYNSLVFKLNNVKEYFPIYVKNVKLPMFNFKKETFQMGPFDRVFPILDNNGMELTVEFIEDSDGFISAFVNNLQSRNFKDGRHNIGSSFGIYVTTYDADGNKVTTYSYRNCYYLKCEAVSLDYEAIDKVTYNVTFLCNRYDLQVSEGTNRDVQPPELLKRPTANTKQDSSVVNRYTPSYKPAPTYNVPAPPLGPLRP
jgi:hypothetical protein